jgi:hypothetical protein
VSDPDSTGAAWPAVPRDEKGHILPGHSLNPGGRRKKPGTDAYLARLERVLTSEDCGELGLPASFVGKTGAEALGFGQFKAGVNGETPAAKEILDRVEGRVAYAITDGDGGPLIPPRVDAMTEVRRILELAVGRDASR